MLPDVTVGDLLKIIGDKEVVIFQLKEVIEKKDAAIAELLERLNASKLEQPGT